MVGPMPNDRVVRHSWRCSNATIDDARRGAEELDAGLKREALWRTRISDAAHRWEGKFRVVCHENNRLRKRLHALTGRAHPARHGSSLTLPLSTPLLDLPLSVRCKNVFFKLGMKTLDDVLSASAHDLLCANNFGEVSLVQLESFLAEHGLALRGARRWVDEWYEARRKGSLR